MYKDFVKIHDVAKNKTTFEMKAIEKDLKELMGPEKYESYLEILKKLPIDKVSLYKLSAEALQLLTDADTFKKYIEITTKPPDDLEAITHIHACVIQEMFLRVYDSLKMNGKRWFLTPEEAILMDIEHLYM